MCEFNIILCRDANNTIDISWDIEDDIQYFKKMTIENIIIMGRKTADTLIKPLKNRINIILTKNQNYRNDEGFISFTNLEKALEYSQQLNKKIFIIGGLALFDEAIKNNKCRNIYINTINKKYENNNLFLSNKFLDELKIYTLNSQENIYSYCNNLKENVNINISHYIYKNHEEIQYLNLLNKIITQGELRETRNAKTYSLFGEKIVFDLQNGFPLLTTKKMFLRGIIEELLFFLKGETNTKILEEKGVNIWKGNTSKEFLKNNNKEYLNEGEMGPMYGYQWRNFNLDYKNKNNVSIDQLDLLIKNIVDDPNSRRLLITSYNPSQAEEGVLYPCHGLITQFYVKNNKISLQTYQRSSDSFLGLPFNIASYALLLHIIVNLVNNNKNRKHKEDYNVGEVITILGDTHIYSDEKADHLSVVKQQISLMEKTYKFPKLNFNVKLQELNDLEKLKASDFVITDYICHPQLKAQMVE